MKLFKKIKRRQDNKYRIAGILCLIIFVFLLLTGCDRLKDTITYVKYGKIKYEITVFYEKDPQKIGSYEFLRKSTIYKTTKIVDFTKNS